MKRLVCVCAALACAAGATASAQGPAPTPRQSEAREILRQLVEIDTSFKGGSTAPAARAVAERFLAAGFPAADVQVIGPAADKDQNVVVRLRGSSSARPILLLAHLDVVEALRSEWSMDPYAFVERDGFFYGRGVSDVKHGAATLIAALLRLRREGVTPHRTLVLALTAGEEGGGGYNGVAWLLANRRDLVDAELCLNLDGGDPMLSKGRHVLRAIQAAEKVFQSFRLEVTDAGGHSSLPKKDNPIYRLAAGLGRLSQFEFPVHLNDTTRAYFTRSATLESGQLAADMRAIAANERDGEAAARLSASPFYNAQLRTTCVATMLSAGHAQNALPQTASAVVNCRILPGEAPADIQAALVGVLSDASIKVTPMQQPAAAVASPLVPAIMGPLERVSERRTPGIPVVPQMETGATDGASLRAAGIPTYGVGPAFIDVDDVRSHGRDERIIAAEFYEGVEFIYELVREIGGAS